MVEATAVAEPLDPRHQEIAALEAEIAAEVDEPVSPEAPLEPSSPAPPEGVAAPEAKAEPTEAAPAVPPDHLQSAFAKFARIQAGDRGPENALTPDELIAHGVWQQSEADRARVWQQSEADRARAEDEGRDNYRQHVEALNTRHDTAEANVLGAVVNTLTEQGYTLEPLVQQVIQRAVKDELQGLRQDSASIVLEPLAAIERSRLVAQLTAIGTPAREAQRVAAALPLVGALPTDDSVVRRLFFAGVETGRRQGASPDQVIRSQKDYDAEIAAARKAGADSVKAAGGPGLPTSNGAPPEAGPMTLKEYYEVTDADLKNPDTKRRFDAYERALEQRELARTT